MTMMGGDMWRGRTRTLSSIKGITIGDVVQWNEGANVGRVRYFSRSYKSAYVCVVRGLLLVKVPVVDLERVKGYDG